MVPAVREAQDGRYLWLRSTTFRLTGAMISTMVRCACGVLNKDKRERDHGGTGQPRAAEQEEVGYGERVRNGKG